MEFRMLVLRRGENWNTPGKPLLQSREENQHQTQSTYDFESVKIPDHIDNSNCHPCFPQAYGFRVCSRGPPIQILTLPDRALHWSTLAKQCQHHEPTVRRYDDRGRRCKERKTIRPEPDSQGLQHEVQQDGHRPDIKPAQ